MHPDVTSETADCCPECGISSAAVLVLVALVLALPGLGDLRRHLAHATPGWVASGAALGLLFALSYGGELPLGVLPTDGLAAQLPDRDGRTGRQLADVSQRRRRTGLMTPTSAPGV